MTAVNPEWYFKYIQAVEIAMADKANERQVGGTHYKQKEGVPEHWDLAIMYNWDPFQYQITKYVMRWKEKGGMADLEKAKHFLEKYIENSHRYNTTMHAKPMSQNEFINQYEEMKQQFRFEGGYGSGNNLYTCTRCGEKVTAGNVFIAYEAHGECKPPVKPDSQ